MSKHADFAESQAAPGHMPSRHERRTRKQLRRRATLMWNAGEIGLVLGAVGAFLSPACVIWNQLSVVGDAHWEQALPIGAVLFLGFTIVAVTSLSLKRYVWKLDDREGRTRRPSLWV